MWSALFSKQPSFLFVINLIYLYLLQLLTSLSCLESFFIFGVTHLVLNKEDTQIIEGCFVTKALIYSFLYIESGREKGDIWGATELLGLVVKLRKSSLLTSTSGNEHTSHLGQSKHTQALYVG